MRNNTARILVSKNDFRGGVRGEEIPLYFKKSPLFKEGVINLGFDKIQQIGKFIWTHSHTNTYVTTDDEYSIIKEHGRYCIYKLINHVDNSYSSTGFWYDDFHSAAEFVDSVLSEQVSLF